MVKKNKVLIIKTGYSETLDKEVSYTSSLGDVLRTTVILHLFKDCHVTWLVDKNAFPLLYNNPHIDRILIYNLTSVLQLQSERFDTVVNFEKVPGICALSDSIKAWRRFGFRFNEVTGEADAYDFAEEARDISMDLEKKKTHKKIWQEALFEMLGHRWNNEGYILGYTPTNLPTFDVGLNWAVGKTYPTKAWPKSSWESLAKKLDSRYSYSWQEGLENIYAYIEWINSCRLLVTSDSLGVHIAIALKKDLVVMYGPTKMGEVFLYNLGKGILPTGQFACMPCFKSTCTNQKFCMEDVAPDQVMKEVELLLSTKTAIKTES